MKKQTKLVAVLSTAALLAIGASMTSFAATGWAEEDGTWVYYDRNGDKVTDKWAKSGNNWYYLDSNGEMAVDQLIEDGDNYYYVDVNGVMAANQWVAIDNEDAGDDDEPEHYWYYFQANGKALKQGDSDTVSLKTVNGKKYAFDDEGKMLYGWVSSDNAERIDNTDDDAFKDGVYYFGGEDDGAMTTGWLLIDVSYDEATNDDYKYTAPTFNDDDDQTRWFYFKSNGKKIYADNGERTKAKTINGKKYAFDEYGAMVAEWSLDEDDEKKASDTEAQEAASTASTSEAWEGNGKYAKYTQAWKYYNSVEDGSRVSKGWFKVVPAEMLNKEKYDDDEESWYYADGSGNLYAGEFKTIKGKKYAFRNDGRMLTGLKFIKEGDEDFADVKADDDDNRPFDNEDDFFDNAIEFYEPIGYKCYYFGGDDDGAMRTGKTTINYDGENTSFYFEKSGGKKGAGVTGEKDDKLYQSGMLLKADSDDKYIVVEKTTHVNADGKAEYSTYRKLDDAKEFMNAEGVVVKDELDGKNGNEAVNIGNGNTKKAEDLSEAYSITYKTEANSKGDKKEYILVNTSGKIVDGKGKNKDGSDYYYVTEKKANGENSIVAIYVED